VVAFQGESVLFCHSFLEDLNGGVGELDGPAAAGAHEVIVMFVVPDVLVPCTPDAALVVDAGSAYDAGLNEQGEVPVHGGQGHGVPLFPEEIEDVVGMEVPIYIANYSQ